MPRPRATLLAAAALALPAAAHAQSVEFRIVERTGQTVITSAADAVLDFAVQARVVAGGPTLGLSTFSFTIILPCEYDSFGTLTRLLISNPDGTYAVNAAQLVNNTVRRGGLAAQFCYLADINPAFNGLVNTSSGAFTNGPYQEIGNIYGRCAGNPLLLVTDLDHDGNPDTWPGSGTAAPTDPAYASTYLGASGNFCDVYRFKYTVTNLAYRTLVFHLDAPTASVASTFELLNGVWTPVETTVPVISHDAIIGDGGAPGSGICCDLSGACTVTVACGCASGQYLAGGTCSANACPQPGACCVGSGACTFTTNEHCLFSVGGHWTAAGAAISCQPNPCPQPGTCCSTATGLCTLVFQSDCAAIWSLGGACTPNPCPQTGACCRLGACTLVTSADCTATGGFFRGISTPCGTPNNPTTCCPANFDLTGGLTVQDIFDFLNAWFASDPRTDFDQDTVLSVNDIFAYLHAWFLGCS